MEISETTADAKATANRKLWLRLSPKIFLYDTSNLGGHIAICLGQPFFVYSA